MNHDPTTAPEHVDAFLDRCDPIEPSRLSTPGIEKTLDEIGAAIASRSLHAPQAARRRSVRRRRTAIVAAAFVAASATIAAAATLSAHTGQFQPTQQQIANAGPSDAARMQSELAMGGPGEFLDPSAPTTATWRSRSPPTSRIRWATSPGAIL